MVAAYFLDKGQVRQLAGVQDGAGDLRALLEPH